MWRYLLCSLLVFCNPVSASLLTAEPRDYLVSYQGIFSAGSRVAIADLRLQTRAANDLGKGLMLIEMSLSSENHTFSETLYPMRYRFRSWCADDVSGCLAFERYEKARKTRHHLYLLDTGLDRPRKVDLLEQPEKTFMRSLLPVDGERPFPLFDRLGLLHKVRKELREPGQVLKLPVSNGRRAMRYVVSVQAFERIEVAGRQWRALKVKFEGFKKDDDGREEQSHRPVFLWFSSDTEHLVLRAVSRHALGSFTIDLNETALM